MTTEAQIIERPNEQKERLAALLLTVPHAQLNYTKALDEAVWLIREAEKVGWHLIVEDK
jgi:hypothetical protein